MIGPCLEVCKALLTAPLDDLRHLIVRVRVRHEGPPPVASALGTVLQEERLGGDWEVVLRDPDRAALFKNEDAAIGSDS